MQTNRKLKKGNMSKNNCIQANLVRMMKLSEGIETLVAEDIFEALAIGCNDTEGLLAVEQFLNGLNEKYDAIENGLI